MSAYLLEFLTNYIGLETTTRRRMLASRTDAGEARLIGTDRPERRWPPVKPWPCLQTLSAREGHRKSVNSEPCNGGGPRPAQARGSPTLDGSQSSDEPNRYDTVTDW